MVGVNLSVDHLLLDGIDERIVDLELAPPGSVNCMLFTEPMEDERRS